MSADVNEVHPLSMPTTSIVANNRDSRKTGPDLSKTTPSTLLPILSIGDRVGAWSVIGATTNLIEALSWSHGCKNLDSCSYRHQSFKRNSGHAYYNMQCECGTIKVTNSPHTSERCPHCQTGDTRWHCNACRKGWNSRRAVSYRCPKCHKAAMRGTLPKQEVA